MLDVHHKEYRELFDVKISDLETLCRRCHDKLHVKLAKKKGKINKRIRREQRLRDKIIKDTQYVMSKKNPFVIRWLILQLIKNIPNKNMFGNTYVSVHY